MLKPNERLDDLQRDGLKIIQNKTMFSFGVDAVLLASSVIAKASDRILDLGTGTGIIPLLLSAKTDAKEIVGVEIQPYVADMARRSVELNNLQDKIQIVGEDFIDYVKSKQGYYDIVVSNPPYFKSGGGIISGNEYKMISRHEIKMNVQSLFESASLALRNRGIFYLIHRPDRLVDVLYHARQNSLEPKRARFVASRIGEAPKLVLIQCIKGAGKELRWEKPIHIYDEDGNYTQEIHQIYSENGITSFGEPR